jgi:hypothetical protein
MRKDAADELVLGTAVSGSADRLVRCSMNRLAMSANEG